MESLKEIRVRYEKTYGVTRPADFNLISTARPFSLQSQYLGCQLENETFRFKFDRLSDDERNEIFQEIERHFRNRLSRKISFELSDDEMSVWISDYLEEKSSYLNAAMDLDNYFRGKKPGPRLIAEHRLYQKNLDWRNPELVTQEIKKLYEENNI